MNLDLLQVEWVAALVLCFVRLYGFMMFFPMISGEHIPAMVRAILGLALTPYLAMPLIHAGDLGLQDVENFYPLIFKEALAGALLGFLCGLPLRLPEIIGSMIDNQRGTAVTDTFNPTSGSDASLLGQWLSITLITYFFVAGGFSQLLALLMGSFRWLPLAEYIPRSGPDTWQMVIDFFSRYVHLFMILTLPVMIAMFLAEISLAVASRFAQSLNVFMLAQPIKSWVAISMMLVMMPHMTQIILAWLRESTEMVTSP
jgi:type III secretion protein T